MQASSPPDIANRTTLAVRILRVIRSRAKNDPIKGAAIGVEFGLDRREIAEFVGQLRDAGEWICASQEKPAGYYYAQSRAELEEYLTKEHQRVMEQLARHKKQRDFIPIGLNLFDEVTT